MPHLSLFQTDIFTVHGTCCVCLITYSPRRVYVSVGQAEDEIASGPGLSDALAIPNPAGGGAGPAPSSSESFRKRHRKPQRGPSSTMLAGMEMLASAGVDPSLFNSLLTSKAGGSMLVSYLGCFYKLPKLPHPSHHVGRWTMVPCKCGIA